MAALSQRARFVGAIGIAVVVIAAAIGAIALTSGSQPSGSKQPTGPGGKALFTRIGFATNCSYVATVRLQPEGWDVAQYGTRGPVPTPTGSPTGPRHHKKVACLFARYDPGVYYSTILLQNGAAVPPAGAIFTYYVPAPGAPTGSEVSIPAGMQMVGTQYYFTCAHEHKPAAPKPFDCQASQPSEPRVAAWVNFPTCWDGTGTAASDVRYPTTSACPPGFDKRFPSDPGADDLAHRGRDGRDVLHGRRVPGVVRELLGSHGPGHVGGELHHDPEPLRSHHQLLPSHAPARVILKPSKDRRPRARSDGPPQGGFAGSATRAATLKWSCGRAELTPDGEQRGTTSSRRIAAGATRPVPAVDGLLAAGRTGHGGRPALEQHASSVSAPFLQGEVAEFISGVLVTEIIRQAAEAKRRGRREVTPVIEASPSMLLDVVEYVRRRGRWLEETVSLELTGVEPLEPELVALRRRAVRTLELGATARENDLTQARSRS